MQSVTQGRKLYGSGIGGVLDPEEEDYCSLEISTLGVKTSVDPV